MDDTKQAEIDSLQAVVAERGRLLGAVLERADQLDAAQIQRLLEQHAALVGYAEELRDATARELAEVRHGRAALGARARAARGPVLASRRA
jgi:hypothetical protein